MTEAPPLLGTLERVSGGGGLRTQSVHGVALGSPTPGERFVLVGEPLVDGDDRLVVTSRVVEVTTPGPGVWEMRTDNSVYRFTEDAPN